MSMDRGIHGGPAKPTGPLNPNLEQNRYRSMEGLGGNKDPKIAGFELVRLLKVSGKFYLTFLFIDFTFSRKLRSLDLPLRMWK